MSDTGMYELIARNKRNSWLLVLILMLLLTATAASFGFYWGGKEYAVGAAVEIGLLGLVFAGALSLFGYFQGTSVIMAISSAHKADPDGERQLHNVVEELCIASGLPKPEVYIIEDSAPNAFACGRNPEHSAVAVTRGLMDKLNRNELQGVLAHELSHIQDYDILFATLITVLVGTIVLMCDLFRRMTFLGMGRRRSSRSDRGGQGQAIIAIVALALMIIAPVFAMIIQFAASRQREYLADAAGAKLTRDPLSLASALGKIAGDPDPLEAANRGTQHLYIINPLKAQAEFQSWFATHPPTKERIRRLREMT